VGKTQAIKNTREMSTAYIQAACITEGIPAEKVTIPDWIKQTDIFEKGE